MEYELSLEFWLCKTLTDIFPKGRVLLYEIEEDVWFCITSDTLLELNLLLEGLEKFTEALKEVPGLALESWL